LINLHHRDKIISLIASRQQKCQDVVFIDRSKEYHSTAGYWPFNTNTHVLFTLFVFVCA